MLELKETINTMVDQLRSFSAEVTRVAKEVGTEGRLGGQAQVEGRLGRLEINITASEPFVVEVWGKLAGVVLKEGDAFRFHAIAPPFLELDGAEFAKPGLARLAAARLDPHTRDGGRSLGWASHWASSRPL